MMAEQAEWTSDSGDHTWHPNYARHAVKALHMDRYDTRTVGQHVSELEQRIVHLEQVVHKYINTGEQSPQE